MDSLMFSQIVSFAQTIMFLGVIVYIHRNVKDTTEKAMSLVAQGNFNATMLPPEESGLSIEGQESIEDEYSRKRDALLEKYPELKDAVGAVDRDIHEGRKLDFDRVAPLAEGFHGNRSL